ncbi:13963_t:CDS:2, partial [Dentiscutata heterogama]
LVQILSFYPQTLNSQISYYNHPKLDDWVRNILFNYDKVRFRRTLRISKSTFFTLVNQIQNHSVFHSNANNMQTDIQIQLAATLFHLGSLSTIWAISAQFGIAESTFHLFIDRVITAIRSLRSEYIKWPQGDFKKEVSEEFQKMQGFPLIIGAIDSSHIPFFEASSRINKDVYFSRKYQYGIHLQRIVNHKGLFINYDIGWPASVHDAKVFQNSNIYKQSTNFFEREEYLLGDSAYPLHSFIMIPIKEETEYNDDAIEIQPEEDSELVNQILDEPNLVQKEYTKVKHQNLLEIVL